MKARKTSPDAHRRFKGAVYEQLARIGKASSSPARLELLDLLGQSPRTVLDLGKLTGQSVANVSQHLQVLRAARLVEAEKCGLYVTYRLADDEVSVFLGALRALAEARLVEMDHVARMFLGDRKELEAVDREALIKRVKRGEVTVLDVRPVEEYEAGHIPGAVSIPVADLKRRLAKLSKSREIVAYCRGPYCVFAFEAVTLLRAHGFKAVRLDEGIPEWKARGLRVEVSAAEVAS
jgi:rhodanese-related sulfurtransferase/predicted transcriptional regulator